MSRTDFPVDLISDLAQRESWRKEIYRPVYHIHKWWARRLGTIFRATILHSSLPEGSNVLDEFYRPHKLDTVIYDPFMGGGTIVGEAIKLGCSVIGRDINPVSYNLVRAALGPIDRKRLTAAYEELESVAAPSVQDLYQVRSPAGEDVTVLYYFWVKYLPCPECDHNVDLFSTYIFSRNALPGKKPEAKVFCPCCGGISSGRYDSDWIQCSHCANEFDPRKGPVNRGKAKCDQCSTEFEIAKVARASGGPPLHRQYAKIILDRAGVKRYEPIWDVDREKYDEASRLLREEGAFIPESPISPGHNTKQVLNYGYTDWREFFNDRQLLALSRLARGILEIDDPDARAQLAILFSGTLEFNNMFASFKGEGTGAVRHMFSHHVLKPERTPLEANPWGTPSSSGSFSTLFRSRLLRALEYRERPFEVSTAFSNGKTKTTKRYDTDSSFLDDVKIKKTPSELEPRSLHLSVGSSHSTDISTGSVDLVVTDPPFFDNVHYSELADFFYIWQAPFFGEPQKLQRNQGQGVTTRAREEVQDTDAGRFSEKLGAVFKDCARVLKPTGKLIFSYHHSRREGWSAVVSAVRAAGLKFSNAYPVISEMAVASPKSQAKEPINIDIIFTCDRYGLGRTSGDNLDAVWRGARIRADRYVRDLASVTNALSTNDIRVVFRSQLIVELCSQTEGVNDLLSALQAGEEYIEAFVREKNALTDR